MTVKEFHKPYEDAFTRAMGDLREVPITDPTTGQSRQMTADDLAQLGFMSLVQAKQVVSQIAPDFAADIMAARNEIRRLWDKRQGALKDAKENGATREQQRAEQFKQGMSALQGQIKQQWTAVNEAALNDPQNGEYFKPRDGDQDWNQRLAKGFELVDRAYSENPANPKLTPEERSSVIKRHAAVRNRAASWGPLKHENKALKSELKRLAAELAKYSDNSPAAGGTQPNGKETSPGSAKEQVLSAFRKKAGV